MNRSDVFNLLRATGPDPRYADKLMLYGRLVGVWDMEATYFGRDGTRKNVKGEWYFDWVLGGMGIQDVLFALRAAPASRGTSLRCYDAKSDIWHITWMQPSGGEFVNLLGRQEGDVIVQDEIASPESQRVRWSFSEISSDSFLWRGEVSIDGGATWFLEQEMHGRRRK
jgi:hypothetical protein